MIRKDLVDKADKAKAKGAGLIMKNPKISVEPQFVKPVCT